MDGIRAVEVNEQRLVLREAGFQRAGDLEIPYTGLYVGEYVSLGELVRASGLSGGVDYAMPQQWFEEYMREKGKRPLGVWWYGDPAHRWEGRFVGLEEILEQIGRELVAHRLVSA